MPRQTNEEIFLEKCNHARLTLKVLQEEQHRTDRPVTRSYLNEVFRASNDEKRREALSDALSNLLAHGHIEKRLVVSSNVVEFWDPSSIRHRGGYPVADLKNAERMDIQRRIGDMVKITGVEGIGKYTGNHEVAELKLNDLPQDEETTKTPKPTVTSKELLDRRAIVDQQIAMLEKEVIPAASPKPTKPPPVKASAKPVAQEAKLATYEEHPVEVKKEVPSGTSLFDDRLFFMSDDGSTLEFTQNETKRILQFFRSIFVG